MLRAVQNVKEKGDDEEVELEKKPGGKETFRVELRERLQGHCYWRR